MKDEENKGYVMLDGVHSIVMPAELGFQVFALLCQGEKVSYDWQNKTHRIDNEGMPSLRMFSITEYATLHLNKE
jgi:hypothetical protein